MNEKDDSPDSYKNKRQIIFDIIIDKYWVSYLQRQIDSINSSYNEQSKDINTIRNILINLDSDYDFIQKK